VRLTLKKYEHAKKIVAEAKAEHETAKAWEAAMKKIGNTGNQKVVTIHFDDEGNITKVESQLDETAGRPILQVDKSGK